MNLKINYKLLFFSSYFTLLLLLSTYQDFPLYNLVGEIGRSASILLVPFFFIEELIFAKYRWRVSAKSINRISNIFLIFIGYYVLITIIYMFWWFSFGEADVNLFGNNIFVKSTKQVSYFITFVLILRATYFILRNIDNKNYVSNIFYYSLLLYFLFLIIEYIMMPNAFLFLHAKAVQYWRIRLLTAEASWTGSIVILLFVGTMHFNISKFRRFVSTLIFVVFLALSGSKLFVLGVLISGVVYILYVRKMSIKNLLLILPVVTLVGYLFIPKVIGSLVNDFENFSSVITRGTGIVAAFSLIDNHPFGVGGFSYYYLANEMQEVGYRLSSFLGGGNLNEIISIAGMDGKNVSTSELGNWVVYMGIPGIVLFFNLYYFLFKHSKVLHILFLGCVYFAFSTSFIENFITKPTIAVFFGLVAYCIDEKNIKNEITCS